MITEICRWGARANPRATLLRYTVHAEPTRYLAAILGQGSVALVEFTFPAIRSAFDWIETQLALEDQTP